MVNEYYDDVQELDKDSKLMLIYWGIRSGHINPDTYELEDNFTTQAFSIKNNYIADYFTWIVQNGESALNTVISSKGSIDNYIAEYQNKYGYEPLAKEAVSYAHEKGYITKSWEQMSSTEKAEIVASVAEIGSTFLPRASEDFIPSVKAIKTATNVKNIGKKTKAFKKILKALGYSKSDVKKVKKIQKIENNGKSIIVICDSCIKSTAKLTANITKTKGHPQYGLTKKQLREKFGVDEIETHHIVEKGRNWASTKQSQAILKANGIKLQDGWNGVFLKPEIHDKLNTEEYSKKVFNELERATNGLKAGSPECKTAIKQTLASIMNRLVEDKF